MRLAVVTEGMTRLVVPAASLGAAAPPTSPVFFNPAASVNRDVSVAVTRATGGRRFCDVMAGVGARGVRVAKEARNEVEVTMVDANSAALRLAARNAAANRVASRCEVSRSDAGAFLHSAGAGGERFDYVDADPFGTPAPFIPPLLHGVADGGVASVTATDAAVLCGVHRRVCGRRYGADPLNNEFCHETAVRILLNACRREAATLDLGIAPVLAHSTRHYVRAFFRVEVGASAADRAFGGEGWVSVCRKCGEREASKERGLSCAYCGGLLRSAGPLWTGRLTDGRVVEAAEAEARSLGFREAARTLGLLKGVDGYPQWSFDLEGVCSALRVPSVPAESVAAELSKMGFKTGRQPFERRGLKTDAGRRDVVRAVMAASSARRRADGQA